MPNRIFRTIEKSDVGKIELRIGGVMCLLADSIGRVQECDIGKRIYIVPNKNHPNDGYTVQCENNEQRDARLGTN